MTMRKLFQNTWLLQNAAEHTEFAAQFRARLVKSKVDVVLPLMAISCVEKIAT